MTVKDFDTYLVEQKSADTIVLDLAGARPWCPACDGTGTDFGNGSPYDAEPCELCYDEDNYEGWDVR